MTNAIVARAIDTSDPSILYDLAFISEPVWTCVRRTRSYCHQRQGSWLFHDWGMPEYISRALAARCSDRLQWLLDMDSVMGGNQYFWFGGDEGSATAVIDASIDRQFNPAATVLLQKILRDTYRRCNGGTTRGHAYPAGLPEYDPIHVMIKGAVHTLIEDQSTVAWQKLVAILALVSQATRTNLSTLQLRGLPEYVTCTMRGLVEPVECLTNLHVQVLRCAAGVWPAIQAYANEVGLHPRRSRFDAKFEPSV